MAGAPRAKEGLINPVFVIPAKADCVCRACPRPDRGIANANAAGGSQGERQGWRESIQCLSALVLIHKGTGSRISLRDSGMTSKIRASLKAHAADGTFARPQTQTGPHMAGR